MEQTIKTQESPPLRGWLGQRGEHTEAVLEQMRQWRRRSDHELEQYRRLAPRGGEVALGGAHFDHFVTGEALAELLRHVGRGDPPRLAAEKAKAYVKEMVDKWNANPQAASVSGKHELYRWPGTMSGALEHVAARLDEAGDPAALITGRLQQIAAGLTEAGRLPAGSDRWIRVGKEAEKIRQLPDPEARRLAASLHLTATVEADIQATLHAHPDLREHGDTGFAYRLAERLRRNEDEAEHTERSRSGDIPHSPGNMLPPGSTTPANQALGIPPHNTEVWSPARQKEVQAAIQKHFGLSGDAAAMLRLGVEELGIDTEHTMRVARGAAVLAGVKTPGPAEIVEAISYREPVKSVLNHASAATVRRIEDVFNAARLELPDHPWLHAHEMPRDEFTQRYEQQNVANSKMSPERLRFYGGLEHKEFVRNAIETGKQLTPAGLEPYPDLKALLPAVGDEVRFEPRNKDEVPVTGHVVAEIRSPNGTRGYHLLSPLPGDEQRVVRVWANRGKVVKTGRKIESPDQAPLTPAEVPPARPDVSPPEVLPGAAVPSQAANDSSAFDPDLEAVPVRGWSTRQLIRKLTGTKGYPDYMADRNIATAQKTGYATDGSFIIRLRPDEQAAVNALPPPDHNGIPAKEIERHLDTRVAPKPCTIRGVRRADPDNPGDWIGRNMVKALYLVEGAPGQRVAVNAEAVKAVLRRYPDATLHMAPLKTAFKKRPIDWQSSPLVFRSGGREVAAIMPWQAENHRLRGE